MAVRRRKRKKKPVCKKGFACGFTCTSRNNTCRSNLDEKGNKIVEDYAAFLARIAVKPTLPPPRLEKKRQDNSLSKTSGNTQDKYVNRGFEKYGTLVEELKAVEFDFEAYKAKRNDDFRTRLAARREFMNSSDEAAQYRELLEKSIQASKEKVDADIALADKKTMRKLKKAEKESKAVLEAERKRLEPIIEREFVKVFGFDVGQYDKMRAVGQKILNKIAEPGEKNREAIEERVKRKKKSRKFDVQNINDAAIMMNGMGLSYISEFKYSDRRAKYSSVEEKVSTNNSRPVMFHEMAHAIEYERPEIMAAARDFRTSRAESPKIKTLRTLTGNTAYRRDEKAVEDSFIAHYAGKIYEFSGSTEIVSMGFEHLASPELVARLALKDPEHFYFIAGIVE